MIRVVLLCGLVPLLLLASTASAIVIRHDVDDSRYWVAASEFPALVDFAHEGHGVLIAPRWIVTAAHATQWHPVTEVMLNGKCRRVARLIVHPGYRKLPDSLRSGDAGPAMRFIASSDDIALIELAEPVTDVTPVPFYRGNDEQGRIAMLYGKGATGNGRDGQRPDGPNRTELRRAYNRISSARGNWLAYVFDQGAAAHPLEGMLGNGDSGGPLLIRIEDRWVLAGLASWKEGRGNIATMRVGFYGQRSYNVRLSRYASWIDDVISTDAG